MNWTPTLYFPERHLRRKSRKSKCVGVPPYGKRGCAALMGDFSAKSP